MFFLEFVDVASLPNIQRRILTLNDNMTRRTIFLKFKNCYYLVTLKKKLSRVSQLNSKPLFSWQFFFFNSKKNPLSKGCNPKNFAFWQKSAPKK